MKYTENQLRIFRDRYAFNGEQFPHEYFKRVATAVAQAEPDVTGRMVQQGQFEWLLEGFKYLPGGRIIAAMGTDAKVTAQNCYVIPSPEDSRGGILHSLGEWIEIQAKGGGVGINLSSLRPRGMEVKSVKGTSSGPVNWAQLFAFVTHDIIQQGGSRRGAAMIMLDDWHPDIIEFIEAKQVSGKLEGCNMSVCISNAFMEAVKTNDTWQLKWSGTLVETVMAHDIWDKIIQSAWASGEPGIYFMERANEQANSSYFETLISTNPCGEQPLGPYGACLLGALNLNAFVITEKKSIINPRQTEIFDEPVFDWADFSRAVKVAVRFNDNIIDLSHYPLPECEESQKRIRRMGIGILGLADALIALKIRYGSPEAEEFTADVYRVLRNSAYEASAYLAKERGAFPAYVSSKFIDNPFVLELPTHVYKAIEDYGIRNCYLLTQAPTGTVSILAGVNSGIEPYFDFSYKRSDRTGNHQYETDWAKEYASENRPDYLVCANDITPEEHIRMQAAAQMYVDSSISKTVNAPESHTVQDVDDTYMMAWDMNLKSIAYYRDNSRSRQVLYHNEEERFTEAEWNARINIGIMQAVHGPGGINDVAKALLTTPPPPPHAHHNKRKKLPDDRPGRVHHFKVDGLTAYLIVGLYPDTLQPGEIFVYMAKQGSTMNGIMDAWALQVSRNLQMGTPVEDVFDKSVGTKFEPYGMTSNPAIPSASSVLDYIGRFMIKAYGPEASKESDPPQEQHSGTAYGRTGDFCPDCGGHLVRRDGCSDCPNPDCWYSKC